MLRWQTRVSSSTTKPGLRITTSHTKAFITIWVRWGVCSSAERSLRSNSWLLVSMSDSIRAKSTCSCQWSIRTSSSDLRMTSVPLAASKEPRVPLKRGRPTSLRNKMLGTTWWRQLRTRPTRITLVVYPKRGKQFKSGTSCLTLSQFTNHPIVWWPQLFFLFNRTGEQLVVCMLPPRKERCQFLFCVR